MASTTIAANGGKSPGASAVWFSYSSLAVYDAVNAITGQYRPFYYQGVGPRDASVDAAAAAPTAFWRIISPPNRPLWKVSYPHL